MELNLYGLEGSILLKMEAGEPITTTSKATREAKARLEAKGLIENDALTELGTSEAESRKRFVGAVRDVYDLKPGGGYLRDIHLVYEPISPFSYAWNWCGLHGVSTVKTDPRKGTAFFDIEETNFWLEGSSLSAEEITFNMPTPETTKAWANGDTISLDGSKIWEINDLYFRFFLDLKEDCFYDILNLAAFQTWLIMDERQFVSCFFIAVTGAYGGGKSVSCEALIFIGRHGKIANPSIAYLGRAMERLGFTIFMDEFDIVVENDPEMGRLARMCQRRGQSYDRATKSGVPQSFTVFGPWIMSVHGMLEDALATRTIPITTEETSNPDVPVVNPEKLRMGQQIYDHMWMWYMDNLDYISHKTERDQEFDFDLEALMNELVIKVADDGVPYVTVDQKGSNIDQVDGHIETNHMYILPNRSNTSNRSNGANMVKQKIYDLRKTVAASILSACTEKQKRIIKASAGRNIELMVTTFKIANIINVNADESIMRAFEIKKEVEEEAREIGVIGHLRDHLVNLYNNRRTMENYWTREGFFMISNLECYNEFTPFLHRREQAGVTPHEFSQALKELGYIKPTSRRKMNVKTLQELNDNDTKKTVRIANVYTDAVQRKLGIKTEQPDFGQRTLQDNFDTPPMPVDGDGEEVKASPSIKIEKKCASCGIPLNNQTGMIFDNMRMHYYCSSCWQAEKRARDGE